jgi:hypothetical protein
MSSNSSFSSISLNKKPILDDIYEHNKENLYEDSIDLNDDDKSIASIDFSESAESKCEKYTIDDHHLEKILSTNFDAKKFVRNDGTCEEFTSGNLKDVISKLQENKTLSMLEGGMAVMLMVDLLSDRKDRKFVQLKLQEPFRILMSSMLKTVVNHMRLNVDEVFTFIEDQYESMTESSKVSSSLTMPSSLTIPIPLPLNHKFEKNNSNADKLIDDIIIDIDSPKETDKNNVRKNSIDEEKRYSTTQPKIINPHSFAFTPTKEIARMTSPKSHRNTCSHYVMYGECKFDRKTNKKFDRKNHEQQCVHSHEFDYNTLVPNGQVWKITKITNDMASGKVLEYLKLGIEYLWVFQFMDRRKGLSHSCFDIPVLYPEMHRDRDFIDIEIRQVVPSTLMENVKISKQNGKYIISKKC